MELLTHVLAAHGDAVAAAAAKMFAGSEEDEGQPMRLRLLIDEVNAARARKHGR